MADKHPTGRPKESWLASDDVDQFVAAMWLCQNASGTCMPDMRCQYGGCFGDDAASELHDLKRRAKNIGYRLVRDD